MAFDSRGTADDIAYSAFSQGTHKCPGERVALVIVQTTLALLVARRAAREGAALVLRAGDAR